jgi:hypothetical protein
MRLRPAPHRTRKASDDGKECPEGERLMFTLGFICGIIATVITILLVRKYQEDDE